MRFRLVMGEVMGVARYRAAVRPTTRTRTLFAHPHVWLIIAILPVVIALRLRTLLFPAQEWGYDEGLFLVMARDLLHGHLPYTLTFDNKPPGLYLIYAGALVVCGGYTQAVYLAACFAIWLSAIAMYALVRRATVGRSDIALLAAFALAFFLCQGRALGAREELFFIPLDIAALAFVWPSGGAQARWRPIAAGLLSGFAICVKPSALADLLDVGAAVALSGPRPWRRVAAMLAAAAAVPLVFALPYALSGQTGLLYDTQVRANLARVALHDSSSYLAHLFARQWLTLFPLPELFLLAPLYLRWAPLTDRVFKRSVVLAAVWACVDLAVIFRVGLIRPRFFMQIEAPLIVLSSIVLWRGIELLCAERRRALRLPVRVFTLAVLAAFLLAKPIQTSASTAAAFLRDGPASVDDQASAVARKMHGIGGSVFFITSYADVEYFLTGRDAPTRYGHIWFLADRGFNTLAAVDPGRELAAVFREPPATVVFEPGILAETDPPAPAFFARITRELRCAYGAPEPVTDGVFLYRRIGSGGGPAAARCVARSASAAPSGVGSAR